MGNKTVCESTRREQGAFTRKNKTRTLCVISHITESECGLPQMLLQWLWEDRLRNAVINVLSGTSRRHSTSTGRSRVVLVTSGNDARKPAIPV